MRRDHGSEIIQESFFTISTMDNSHSHNNNSNSNKSDNNNNGSNNISIYNGNITILIIKNKMIIRVLSNNK